MQSDVSDELVRVGEYNAEARAQITWSVLTPCPEHLDNGCGGARLDDLLLKRRPFGCCPPRCESR